MLDLGLQGICWWHQFLWSQGYGQGYVEHPGSTQEHPVFRQKLLC